MEIIDNALTLCEKKIEEATTSKAVAAADTDVDMVDFDSSFDCSVEITDNNNGANTKNNQVPTSSNNNMASGNSVTKPSLPSGEVAARKLVLIDPNSCSILSCYLTLYLNSLTLIFSLTLSCKN